MQIVCGFQRIGRALVFVGEDVAATSNTFIANLTAIAADEPKHLRAGFPAEGTIAVAHGMPHKSFGADRPRSCSAACKMVNVLAGKRLRFFHIGTADALFLSVISATAWGPPSSAMTSSTVWRRLIMETEIITRCDNVKRHRRELDLRRTVLQTVAMGREQDYPFVDQGRRLRWLRQAERITTGSAFAAKVGWPQSGYSQFETGKRRVPLDKALQLAQKIPGFDPTWLWNGDKKGLSFDLRQRIDAEEAKDANPQLASGER